MNFRTQAVIGLSAYFVIILLSMRFIDDITHDWIPPYAYVIHFIIIFAGMVILSMILTDTYKITYQNLTIAVVVFIIEELFSICSSQMITLDGTLIKTPLLWNMGIDSLIGWLIIQTGLQKEWIYYATYIITPVVLVTIMCLLLSKTELKKVVRKVVG